MKIFERCKEENCFLWSLIEICTFPLAVPLDDLILTAIITFVTLIHRFRPTITCIKCLESLDFIIACILFNSSSLPTFTTTSVDMLTYINCRMCSFFPSYQLSFLAPRNGFVTPFFNRGKMFTLLSTIFYHYYLYPSTA